MKYSESAASVTKEPLEAIKLIADSMIASRPREEVTYRPYKKTDVYFDQHLGLRKINLKKLYPNAKAGNVVYVGTVIEACVEGDAKINFQGNAKVIFGDKVIFDSLTDKDADGNSRCPIHLKKGENPVLFMVRCDSDDKFEFNFMPSVRWYWIWAKCYILSARATSPIPEYKGEDGVGISALYESEALFDGRFVYPEVKVYENKIDFSEIFAEANGKYAYALTYALEDTSLEIKTDCAHKIFINGAVGHTKCLRAGDSVLVKLEKGDSRSLEFSGEHIGIPFLHSSRASGDRFLTLGTFGDESDTLDTAFEPESSIRFKKPYSSAEGTSFWKLAHKDDFVRPYLLSRFFGQWHYSFMVGEFGLLNAYKATKNEEYLSYFCDHMKVMTDYFHYMRYEHKHFSSPSFLDISASLHDLDSIGSIGRNLCEYYKISGNKEVLPIIDTLLDAMNKNIRRFPDGTFHRHTDMWADDTFMSCPFLVEAGILKNDKSYHEEVIRQLSGFKKRLWMNDEKIFSHIFFLNPPEPNNIPWGRGNGWIYVSLSDALSKISPETEGYGELMETFLAFTDGICALQDKDGLWHQVLNRHDSYSETSCTAMFTLGLCRGVKNGWLDKRYLEYAKRAYLGILTHKIDKNGTVYDVCMGSGNARDVNYYMNLGAIDNDDHGTGVILSAISALSELM